MNVLNENVTLLLAAVFVCSYDCVHASSPKQSAEMQET